MPVLLGAVHAMTGNSMPSRVPAKGRWLTEDTKRNALFMSVPFQGEPAAFGTENFNTILCQRVLTAIAEKKGYESNELAGAFMAFYKSIWGVKPFNDINVMDPKFVLSCSVAAGFTTTEAEEFLHSAEDKTIKSLLKENTTLAVEKGAFGAPTMFIPSPNGQEKRDMMFFGSDRFEQMAFAISKPWAGHNPSMSKL